MGHYYYFIIIIMMIICISISIVIININLTIELLLLSLLVLILILTIPMCGAGRQRRPGRQGICRDLIPGDACAEHRGSNNRIQTQTLDHAPRVIGQTSVSSCSPKEALETFEVVCQPPRRLAASPPRRLAASPTGRLAH